MAFIQLLPISLNKSKTIAFDVGSVKTLRSLKSSFGKDPLSIAINYKYGVYIFIKFFPETNTKLSH